MKCQIFMNIHLPVELRERPCQIAKGNLQNKVK